jgi:predicted nucleotidyltransferase
MIILLNRRDIEMKGTHRMAETIKGLLGKIPGIQCAFIYGSYPRNLKHPEGDVEIMVVGTPDLVELDESISIVEEDLGMPIDITSFTVREFQERLNVRDPLVSRALKGPRITLVGEDPLANQGSIHYNSR